MNIAYPTSPSAYVAQAWGNANAKLYPGGRHMGIDLAAPVGAPIYAAGDGTVHTVSLVNLHGYGRHVFIQHDGFQTLYAHMHAVYVKVGQIVSAGERIGEVGGQPGDADPIDGASSGAHLHFEVVLPAAPVGDTVKTFAGWTVNPLDYLTTRFAPPPKFKAKIISSNGVKLRAGPSTSSQILGALIALEEYSVMETAAVGADVWAKMWSLRDEWAAVEYGGVKLMTLTPLSDPPVTEYGDIPPNPADLGGEFRRDEVDRMIAFLNQRRAELK